jgi:hypothetical protein
MDELLGSIIGIIIVIAIVLFFIFYVLIPFLSIVGGIGAVYGGGVAVKNYVVSLKNNVNFRD